MKFGFKRTEKRPMPDVAGFVIRSTFVPTRAYRDRQQVLASVGFCLPAIGSWHRKKLWITERACERRSAKL